MRIIFIALLMSLSLFSCSQSSKEKRKEAIEKKNSALNLYSNSMLMLTLNNDTIKKVIDLLDESIAIDSKYTSSYYYKASMLSKLGKTQDAIQVISTAIDFDKKEEIAELLTLRGILYERNNQFDLAKLDYENLINSFNETLKKEPDNFYALSNRAVVIALNEHLEKGLEELNKIDMTNLTEKDLRQLNFLKKTLADSSREEIIERIDM